MIDFMMISTRSTKRGVLEIYPKFIIGKSSDLMIRGGDFYAIWIEELGLWSTDEQDVIRLVDRELDDFAEKNRQKFESGIKIMYMWDAESGTIDAWHKYCQKQLRDSFHMLDEKLIFSNTKTTKKDYASKRLNYPLEPGPITAYDRLISTIYNEDERHKIEWCIGSIVNGDSRTLQKFMVLYGSGGTGKSTIINIIQMLFDGYCAVFDAKALGSSSNSFALEAFKTNPLVALQHDGDLSRIEDNTRINSLVSHELMTVNEKFKSTYSNRFKAFLFMGTNKPVKITDAKSGLIRRLIDVTPSGRLLESDEYDQVVGAIPFELGGIASHCQEVFLSNPKAYNDYIPTMMLGASNDFYNFVLDSYNIFKKEDGTTLKASWEMYKNYCDDAKVPYPLPQRAFKEELKNYFDDYKERYSMDDGTRARSYYSGFQTSKFEEVIISGTREKEEFKTWLRLEKIPSLFDVMASSYTAQYSKSNETPATFWSKVTTTLSSLDTSKLHYVKVPTCHIVIDFDLKNSDGEKDYQLNLEAASKWPPTYAELSKGGQGIHLHYIYTGDPERLSRMYDDDIEVKVYTGDSSLRRRLSKCNNIPVAEISSGLPLKGEKMVNFEGIKNEKMLRSQIKRNLNKEYHAHTAPSVSFIHKILEDAYNSDMFYDVSDMRNEVLMFAMSSNNQSKFCIGLVSDMKFKSQDISENTEDGKAPIVFFDVEVFPNLFVLNWKFQGEGKPIARMINPTPSEIEPLLKYRLIAFNNRRYDNHIVYARLMGYSNAELFALSQRIIDNQPNCMFSEAYNLSYTDIYDYMSAGNKMSLKKWEIKLRIHHQELGLPWDRPVPEELWTKVAEYCDNDVLAAEAVFDATQADFTARKILATMAGMTENDTTNTLTTRIIFKKNRNPQSAFNYRDLAKPVKSIDPETKKFLFEAKPEMMSSEHVSWQYMNANPESIPESARSILPYFPTYEYSFGVSTYRGEKVGEGGCVRATPGMYGNVALLDVVSMHPNSTIAEVLFGVDFTRRFKEIVDGRVSIKHEAWEEVNNMLDGALTPFIQLVLDGKMTSKELADGLKTAINSVYGLTSATFDNPFRDKRNKDNIVAKRGALFMIDLKHAVEELGYISAHIKTDSIKIPDATPEIINFVMTFGLRYGYTFEHEATYDRMCLVNDAVYIAKYASIDKCQSLYGYVPGDNKKKENSWTATGTQFAVPYVFKKLFSHEPIIFDDMCETKSVTTALYLDRNEGLPDATIEEKVESLRDMVRKGKSDKITQKDRKLLSEWDHISEEELRTIIEERHAYHFVGKVGLFCPIKPGKGGGDLLREKKSDGPFRSFGAATGGKDYRWLEAELVKELGKEEDIDKSYYNNLVDEAYDSIKQYGDAEWFISDDPYVGPSYHDLPF